MGYPHRKAKTTVRDWDVGVLPENGKLEEYEGALRLTREGIFISDSIMSDLLWVD